MSKFLDWVEIKNFKSIKQTRFDCKRVNVLIGKPNVGKSNILEALGLLNGSNSIPSLSQSMVRYEKFHNLFFKNDLLQTISVNANDKLHYIIRRKHTDDSFVFEYFIGSSVQITEIINTLPFNSYMPNDIDFKRSHQFYEDAIRKNENWKDSPSNYAILHANGSCLVDFGWFGQVRNIASIRKYNFKPIFDFSSYPFFETELFSPNGDNLFHIIDTNQTLRKEIIAIFKEYGLEFVVSRNDSKFYIQHNEDGYVYQYPYSSIADTFQRYIFYLAAIASNNDAVLIFEEPEVHSFPPFVRDLALKMVEKDNNQYFVSTHSPYLLQTLISELDDSELNICLTYYKDYQTQVKVLSAAEVQDIRDFGYDVFFNLNKFEPND
jgi:AAA15 family ATPase/GTPase